VLSNATVWYTSGRRFIGVRVMGSLSLFHWVVVIAVALLLFGGRGKISGIMGDFAKGIKAFKKGMAEDEPADAAAPQAPPVIAPQAQAQTPHHTETAEAHPRS
jgi:sec-independent protein translocase protein TatA